MRRRRRSIEVLALSLAIIVAVPQAGMAGATTFRIPQAAALADPCHGGTVFVEWTAQVVFRSSTDSSGGTHHEMEYVSTELSGVNLSGSLYSGLIRNATVFNFSDPAFETTLQESMKLISRGRTENLLIDSLVHLTINANGILTATVERMTVTCQG